MGERSTRIPELEFQPDARTFISGPLAGLAIKTALSESAFYEEYSELAGRKGDHDKPAATYIADPNNPHHYPVTEVARALEHLVFYPLDGNTRTSLDNKYGPREPRSHFVVALDYQEDPQLPFPAAMVRMDNTLLAKVSPRTYSGMPTGYVSIEDIPMWGVEIEETLEKTGLPPLRYSDSVTDIVTVARHPFYTPSRAKGGAGNMQRSDPIQVAQALYHEVCQLNRDYMVTILNAPAHRSIQALGRPWPEYAGHLQPIRYDGEHSTYLSLPYWHDRAAYRERLSTTEPGGPAIKTLLFDPWHGPADIHFGTTAMLELHGAFHGFSKKTTVQYT